MAIADLLGTEKPKKVRYAIVGLGSIAQEAMMPGVEATGNSEITALVTGDATKAAELSKLYKGAATYSYEQYPELLASKQIDAVYIATPNWRHAEFAVPALAAGIHVLLEKPMEVSSEKCEEILKAHGTSSAKLMVAYRLHFEPATIAAVEKVRSGELGEVNLFSSVFSQMVKPENHRAQNGAAAGPLFDMGPYPINAARNFFSDEPIEAFGAATRHPSSGFGDLDDTVTAVLRFPGNRMAQFTVSYYGSPQGAYTLLGTEASLEVNPGYTYGKPLEHLLTREEKTEHTSFKNTDHFGGEIKYFSSCILDDRQPEPDGREGLADVRIIEAIARSIQSGKFEKVDAVQGLIRIDPRHEENLPARKTPEMVHASAPARGITKNPKN